MRQLGRSLVLLFALAVSPVVGATEIADVELPLIEIDSSAELMAAESQSLKLEIESIEDTPASEELDQAIQIAEPGTLGLLALAGLMGGAVAMRRRLG